MANCVSTPQDPGVYQRFIGLIARLNTDSQALRELNLSGLDFRLAEADDFAAANASIQLAQEAMNTTVNAIEEVIAGLDAIFGAGVCELFLQGTRDPELLQPLLEGVLPYFQTARAQLLQKYQAQPQSENGDVLEA